jgi:hypothetical protein
MGRGFYELYVDGLKIDSVPGDSIDSLLDLNDVATREFLNWVSPYADEARNLCRVNTKIALENRVTRLTEELKTAKKALHLYNTPGAITDYSAIAVGFSLEIKYQFACIVAEASGDALPTRERFSKTA